MAKEDEKKDKKKEKSFSLPCSSEEHTQAVEDKRLYDRLLARTTADN